MVFSKSKKPIQTDFIGFNGYCNPWLTRDARKGVCCIAIAGLCLDDTESELWAFEEDKEVSHVKPPSIYEAGNVRINHLKPLQSF
jgi:hypothetical protein